MPSKSKSRSKGKSKPKYKRVEKLPKTAPKGTVVQMKTTKGTRYFESTGRTMFKPVKKPK